MFDRVYVHQWMSLAKEVRERLATVFNIQKSGIVEIINEKVLTDGRTNEDLATITLDKLNAYVGSHGTFAEAWELAVKKAGYFSKPVTISMGDIQVMPVDDLPKPYCDTCASTKGRHRKGCPKFK